MRSLLCLARSSYDMWIVIAVCVVGYFVLRGHLLRLMAHWLNKWARKAAAARARRYFDLVNGVRDPGKVCLPGPSRFFKTGVAHSSAAGRAVTSGIAVLVAGGTLAISIMVLLRKAEWGRIDPAWYVAPVVFTAITLATGVWWVRCLLQSRLSKVSFVLRPDMVTYGEPFRIEWRVTGDTSRMQRLDISLVPFRFVSKAGLRKIAEFTLVATEDPALLAAGAAGCTVPSADEIRVLEHPPALWRIVVRGKMDGPVDLREEYPFDLLVRPETLQWYEDEFLGTDSEGQ